MLAAKQVRDSVPITAQTPWQTCLAEEGFEATEAWKEILTFLGSMEPRSMYQEGACVRRNLCLRGKYCSADDDASKQCQRVLRTSVTNVERRRRGSTTSPSDHSGSDEGDSTSGDGSTHSNSKREQQENSIQVFKH